jgi:hypothetical protein
MNVGMLYGRRCPVLSRGHDKERGRALHATCSIAELFLSSGAFVGSMNINHGAGLVQFHRKIRALFQTLDFGFLA